MIRVMLYDRFDQPIGELSEKDVFALVRTERINGEHSLKITTTRILEKGQRILTCDERGKWREHVVYGTDALHESGDKPTGDYYCVWSLQHDLMGTRVSMMPGVQTPVTAAVALAAALSGTNRWAVGTVTDTATGGASMYDTDGWSALTTLISVWGGEVDATIEVGSTGVTARKCDLYAQQGDQTAKRRYDFGADLKSVRRRMPDGPLYCRITPRGMGEETENGGYGRKVTIESVNDGKDYLENASMVPLAKLPDGNGGWEYPTLEVENSDCETPAELLAWAQPLVDEYTVPKITYEVDVLQLAEEGVDMHGVSLGDAVHIVDRKFGEGIRTSGRVMQTEADMLDPADMSITIGDIANDISTLIGGLGARLTAVSNTVQAINGGTMDAANYLERLVERINAEINASGGYTYITENNGIRCYDAAVTDPLVGAEASKVVEIKGGTIRIANTKTAQGAWEWKTVFASGLVASDVLSADNIITGAIRVQDANQNAVFVADMDAGTVSMAGDAITIGQRTLAEATGTVYGTFEYTTMPDSTHRYSIVTAPFEPTDDTVLKVKWVSNTSYGFSYDPAIYINGAKLTQYFGSNFHLPSDLRLQKDKMIVMEVEHYDSSNPTRWRWLVTGVEDVTASEADATRAAFARDTSEIEINGGKVTFNAGTFVVNSTNFTVSDTGVITATAGTLGGFDISPLLISNDAMELNGDGLYFLRNGQIVAAIDPVLATSQIDASELNLLVPKKFNFLAKAPSSSGSSVRPAYYELNTSYGDGTGILTIACDTRFNGDVILPDALTTAITVPRRNDSGFNTYTVSGGYVTDFDEYPGTNFFNGTITIGGVTLNFTAGRLTGWS